MTINLTIPIYNEEKQLANSITRICDFVSKNMNGYEWEIVIADNASTDSSPIIGKQLADTFSIVKYVRINKKGRGLALRTVWKKSNMDIFSYMDVDLSTNLTYYPVLINAIAKEKYDVAIGSRMLKKSKVVRSLYRSFMSYGYNFLTYLLFKTAVKDAQCGFKAIKNSTFTNLECYLKHDSFFFDTQLLFWAEHKKACIAEIPVIWHEDTDSRVNIPCTIIEDLIGLLILRWKLWRTLNNE